MPDIATSIALNTIAASGGRMIIAESAITLEVMPIRPTAYGRAHRGAPENAARIRAPNSPVCSARPTASMMVTTVSSGGKPMKFEGISVKRKANPSPLSAPRTGMVSSEPGICTVTVSTSSGGAVPRTR